MEDKVVVRADFLKSTHGQQSCASCHGGVESATDKATAHQGLVRDPSGRQDNTCGTCHAATVSTATKSLHTTLDGFMSVLARRGGNISNHSIQQGFDNHCASCHATCGQCHVSRPTSVGGGLLSGHQFKKTPPMKETCTSCHVTRVGQEYLGENPGVDGDVHWTKAGMVCTKCHSSELHAASKEGDSRYSNPPAQQCLDCHQKVVGGSSGIAQHDLHGDRLSCQVCHSVQYKNCDSCHVGKDATGVKYFKTEGTELAFKIGLNPLRSPERPYKYVTLRHAPAAESAFDYYAPDLLPDFDALPTWKYATPHNISRKTPQNSSCNACHGNKDLFLTSSDLKPNEVEANQPVLVPAIPPSR